MTEKADLDIRTKLVHAGERQSLPSGLPVATPIYATATFTYESMADMDAVFAGEKAGYVYTRHGNPTLNALEEAVRTLEQGATACAYSSGMAAIHAALFACDMKPGATVLASQHLYGATTNLLSTVFGSFGIKTVTANFADLEQLQNIAKDVHPTVLIAETISNPLLTVCDIEACVEIAREVNARLIIDNTFATPYVCQPLRFGADIVVHSATKYLGGHGDATGGIVISRDQMDSLSLVSVMKLVGGVLSVWEAHEILRGLKTLSVRFDRQCENARALAEHLKADKRVGKVYYPGLTEESEDAAARILGSSLRGAMVSIELADNTRERAFRFMDALRLIVRSTSLGDVFTSALHPASSSHRDMLPAKQRELGITEGLIRISAGIEEINDLIEDVDRALSSSGE